jgi:hypothetical protein
MDKLFPAWYIPVKNRNKSTYNPSSKQNHLTKLYFARYQAKKNQTFSKTNNDDLSVNFANFFDGGLDFSDAINYLLQINSFYC